MSSAFEGLPKTPNLKLNKPGYDNVADIEALNENADILDAEIQGIKNTFVKSVNGINAGDGGNVDLGIIPIAKGGTGQTTASGVRNALGLGNTTGALPIANGGTGATTKAAAQTNLGLNDAIVGLSVSGRTITYKQADGGTGTITTQDTVGVTPKRYITTTYIRGTNWYEVYNDGWIRQGGIIGAGATVTFLKPFKNTNYTLCASMKSSSSGSAVTWAQCTPQNKKTTGFQTNGNGVGFEWIAEGMGA